MMVNDTRLPGSRPFRHRRTSGRATAVAVFGVAVDDHRRACS